MIIKKFCLVGVEFDFEDLTIDEYNNYLGFFTSGHLVKQCGIDYFNYLEENQLKWPHHLQDPLLNELHSSNYHYVQHQFHQH